MKSFGMNLLQWASSEEDALLMVEEFEVSTLTKYIVKKKHECDLSRSKVHWDRPSHVPYIIVRSKQLECQHAKDKNKIYNAMRSRRNISKRDGSSDKRKRIAASKKADCKAVIYFTEVLKFPQHQLVSLKSIRSRMNQSHKIKSALSSNDETLLKKRCWKVEFPSDDAHSGHPVGVDAGSLQATDRRIVAKIEEFAFDRSCCYQEVRAALISFVQCILFYGKEFPDPSNRRFYPTKQKIQALYSAAVRRKQRLHERNHSSNSTPKRAKTSTSSTYVGAALSAVDDLLINEVRARPQLYDTSSLHFHDPVLKNSCWNEIGVRLNLSVDDCQDRWKYLKEVYWRLKRRKRISSETHVHLMTAMSFVNSYLFCENHDIASAVVSHPKKLEHLSKGDAVTLLLEPCSEEVVDESDASIPVISGDGKIPGPGRIEVSVESEMSLDELLINEVHACPPIHDPSSKDYGSSVVKDNCWMEIGSHLNLSVVECKKRWHFLKEMYCKLRSCDNIAEYADSLMKAMSFVDPHLQLERKISAIDSSFGGSHGKEAEHLFESQAGSLPLEALSEERGVASKTTADAPDENTRFMMSFVPVLNDLEPQQSSNLKLKFLKVFEENQLEKR